MQQDLLFVFQEMSHKMVKIYNRYFETHKILQEQIDSDFIQDQNETNLLHNTYHYIDKILKIVSSNTDIGIKSILEEYSKLYFHLTSIGIKFLF